MCFTMSWFLFYVLEMGVEITFFFFDRQIIRFYNKHFYLPEFSMDNLHNCLPCKALIKALFLSQPSNFINLSPQGLIKTCLSLTKSP